MSGLKTAVVAVPAEWGERDKGKTFLITEMPAAPAEKWGMRMFLALKGTSAQVDEYVARMGMIGVAIRGLNAFLSSDIRYEDIRPLLEEMFECVRIIRDPGTRNRETGDQVATDLVSDDDIAEVRTRMWLRSEVLALHTNFSFADALFRLISAINSQTAPPSS